jgi:hypothetical protein
MLADRRKIDHVQFETLLIPDWDRPPLSRLDLAADPVISP